MPEDAPNVLEAGGTEVSTSAGGARRYRKPLKSFRWCDIKALLGESFSEWSRHKGPRLGASLAFYTLLSLTPLLLVVVSFAGLVFGPKAAAGQVVWQIQTWLAVRRPVEFKRSWKAPVTRPTASPRPDRSSNVTIRRVRSTD